MIIIHLVNFIYNYLMLDKEFLNTLTILYVDDDEKTRDLLLSIFQKVFANVIVCNDGKEGLEEFNNYIFDKQTKIDLIISDINMPNMNGIEMVKNIRELDSQIPVIFTTQDDDKNNLMDAITLNIASFILKPIDMKLLLNSILKFTKIEHNNQILEEKRKEMAEYMDIMHHISTIFKVDTSGKIIDTNTMLSQLSEYSQSELLEKTVDDILDKDAVMIDFKTIEEFVSSCSLYKGKLKFLSKIKRAFYLNTTVLPMYNDLDMELKGYIFIGIDQTIDEQEKQQKMQRVRQNIKEQREKESELLKKIKSLELEIKEILSTRLTQKETEIVLDKLTKEKKKAEILKDQLGHYELKIQLLLKQKESLLHEDKKRKHELAKRKNETNKEIKQMELKIIELQSQIEKK